MTLQLELREDEMRGRRADVDPDGPQAQALGGDVDSVVIGIVAGMAVIVRVMRMR